MSENNLDDLVKNYGSETNNIQSVSSENVINQFDSLTKNSMPYDDGGVMIPGQKVVFPTSETVQMTDEAAETHMVKQVALHKLEKENEEFKKLSDDAKVKEYVLKSQYYRETNEFYKKHGFEMSGKQKRTLTRELEKLWNKGRFKITPEQREDIIYELNKASNTPINAQAPVTNNETNGSEYIKDLNSLIFNA